MMAGDLRVNCRKGAGLGFLPWLMWGLGALFYCYEFSLQVSTSVMKDILMQEYNITAASLGNLSSFYLYAYAFMQIPVGILLDRFGARRLLTLASLCCAVGAFLFAHSEAYWVAACGRALIGFGSAFAAVSCMQIAACWLPLRHFALMTGMLLTIGMLGAFFGEGPFSQLISFYGWRDTLSLFGYVGIGLASIIYLVVRDRSACENATRSRVLDTTFFSGLKYVIRQPRVWIPAVYGGLMYMSILGYTSLWGVPFLSTIYGLDQTTAAFINSLTFIGFAIGAPFFGWFSDRIGRRKTPMQIAASMSLLLISAIIYVPDLSITTMGTLLTLFGFFVSGFLPVFSVTREVTPPESNATTLGFVNTLNTLGGAGAAVIIGRVLDLNLHHITQEGQRVYDAHAYHNALIILPIAFALALVTLFFVKETYCQQQTNFS